MLSLRPDGLVGDVTAFIVRATDAAAESYLRFPQHPIDARRLAVGFERLGLPDALAAS